jgi:hypothetical protein
MLSKRKEQQRPGADRARAGPVSSWEQDVDVNSLTTNYRAQATTHGSILSISLLNEADSASIQWLLRPESCFSNNHQRQRSRA